MTHKKRSLFSTAVAALITLSVLGFALYFFLNAGLLLYKTDRLPQKSDALFTFGGESVRDQYALELARKYPQAELLVSGKNRGRFFSLCQKQGIDTVRVRYVDTCNSTLSEVNWLADQIRLRPVSLSHIGLISGPYHMGRISFLIHKKFRLQNSQHFYFLPVPLAKYGHTIDNYRYWWREAHLRQLILSEWQKLIGSFIVQL